MQALKTLILILALIISARSYGQLDKLVGVWISQTSDAIKIEIENTTSDFGSSTLSNLKMDINCKAVADKDTLTLQYTYYTFLKGKSIYHADPYSFIICSLNDSTLVLKPCSKYSKAFFNNRSLLAFTRQKKAIDTSIQFRKLYFHTTTCLGTCPMFHLEIDSNKKIKLFAERIITFDSNGVQGDDTVKQGYFSGILDDISFGKFINAIQTCNLQKLTIPKVIGYDGSTITIIIYFNSTRKYFQSMFPPIILDNLIQTLYDICETSNLQKTNDRFVLEE